MFWLLNCATSFPVAIMKMYSPLPRHDLSWTRIFVKTPLFNSTFHYCVSLKLPAAPHLFFSIPQCLTNRRQMTQWKNHTETSPDNNLQSDWRKNPGGLWSKHKKSSHSPHLVSVEQAVQLCVWMYFCGVFVCVCVCMLKHCVQYNGRHGNILKSYKHWVVVAVYYRLKFAVNDLCLQIFKQMYFVWEPCLTNSNYSLRKNMFCPTVGL